MNAPPGMQGAACLAMGDCYDATVAFRAGLVLEPSNAVMSDGLKEAEVGSRSLARSRSLTRCLARSRSLSFFVPSQCQFDCNHDPRCQEGRCALARWCVTGCLASLDQLAS